MRYPTLAASPQPPFDVSSFAPPGISIINNMMLARFHRGPSALTYAWFYQQVRARGPWDYKNRCGRQYANFGNFHYGAVGQAAGIKEEILLRAAGWAQNRAGTSEPEFGNWYRSAPYGDDPDDQAWIKMGIDYAKRTGF
ncbi:polymorphic toxin type 44 domain-containing protein [Leclercia adecarboxylata]|uniref:polymorphic toxin type 44 domain-containing protein n=1 Tax=Leclercia adecarboxylata TaxID=83655 RepID=UPI00330683BB